MKTINHYDLPYNQFTAILDEIKNIPESSIAEIDKIIFDKILSLGQSLL